MLEIFQKFKKMAKLHSERKINLLKIDGEGEYTSNEFRSFCERRE